MENLFLNSLAFEFPEEPVVFYFSHENISDRPLVRMASSILWPENVRTIFPNLAEGDDIFTSYTDQYEGMKPLEVDLRREGNYYFAKRYANRLIRKYFQSRFPKCILSIISITKDNEIWVKSNEPAEYANCARFDRFLLRIDFNHFKKKPQLLLSYNGTSHVIYDSVEKLRGRLRANDPFELNATDISEALGKVVYLQHPSRNGHNLFIVDKYKFLQEHKPDFDSSNAYPILNRYLMNALGYKSPTIEHKENPLQKYRNKIEAFYKHYLDNEQFRAVIPISTNGFTQVEECQSGMTASECNTLLFGNGATHYSPTFGLNNGPYLPVPVDEIMLFCVFHTEEKNFARYLVNSLRDGYGAYKIYSKPVINPFTGKSDEKIDVLKRFTGRDTKFAQFFIEFHNKRDPFPEVQQKMIEAFANGRLKKNIAYMALYVSPINKQDVDHNAQMAYSRIKDALLSHNIMTQVILTENIGAINRNKLNKKGEFEVSPIPGFAYTLQNMALAICAKMGGTPWRIATQKKNELVIGIGAFFNQEKGATYIGSAFSFDNTGTFNSFECFMKDQMRALVGSIKEAIMKFASINGKPDKVVIHYYKQMSRKKEYQPIEEMLNSLELGQIPVYVVTVNKTDSEDYVVFNNSHQSMLPYSGTYICLGNGKFLLCNNTRYFNTNAQLDGYPFPVKIKIWSPKTSTGQIDTNIIQGLIEQVYQFSRIYFKSVKQQHLPVTLKYPELLSEMLSSFDSLSTDHIDSNRLWFL